MTSDFKVTATGVIIEDLGERMRKARAHASGTLSFEEESQSLNVNSRGFQDASQSVPQRYFCEENGRVFIKAEPTLASILFGPSIKSDKESHPRLC
jgi:hypothetical protein